MINPNEKIEWKKTQVATKNFASLIPYQPLSTFYNIYCKQHFKKSAFRQYFSLLIIYYGSELFLIVVFTYLAKENQEEFHESHTFDYSALVWMRLKHVLGPTF